MAINPVVWHNYSRFSKVSVEMATAANYSSRSSVRISYASVPPLHNIARTRRLRHPMTVESLCLVRSKCPLCQRDDGVPQAIGEDFEYRSVPDTFLVLKCNRCDVLYLNPQPAESEFGRIYPSNYHAYEFSEENFGLVHRIRRRLEARRLLKWCKGLSQDAKIIDIGCGDGFHLKLLREFGSPNWVLRGVDKDSKAVDRARTDGIDVFEGSLESFGSSDRYDLALTIMTIEHLHDPIRTLRAALELLNPGGRLVIVTDNTGSPDYKIAGGRYWGGYHFPRHFQLFNRQSLTNLACAAGFECQCVNTGLSPVNWVYSIRNCIDDMGAPAWLVRRFTLQSPISLAVFTIVDLPLSLLGKGAILQGIFRKPISTSPRKL